MCARNRRKKELCLFLRRLRIGPRPKYIPSRLTGLVPALSIYPLASTDWSPRARSSVGPHCTRLRTGRVSMWCACCWPRAPTRISRIGSAPPLFHPLFLPLDPLPPPTFLRICPLMRLHAPVDNQRPTIHPRRAAPITTSATELRRL
eukprot:605829-Pyramimonas_sp.AAC.2